MAPGRNLVAEFRGDVAVLDFKLGRRKHDDMEAVLGKVVL